MLHYYEESLSLYSVSYRNMERAKRDKIWVVWLLSAVLTMPFAVKTIHICHAAEHSEHSCSDESHAHHDCNDCPVCQFTLSSFTEATVADYDFTVIPCRFEAVISLWKKPYRQVLISYGLRAPPML
jgi:hypothetical protein